ncbi:carbohydrate porin [Maridesulfovibrio sp.]|uniref:carbohydrate porin n=1 Tax=Maridesulfovibrio sp. TaxID=2795000 RepID=UPI002A1887F9|nr:carbohydrate porin [Maridesulfovibrio sp.]
MKIKILPLLLFLILATARPAFCEDSLRDYLGLHGNSERTKSVLLQSIRKQWDEFQNATGPMTIDGDVLAYWDGYSDTRINGESKEGKDQGAVKARVRLNWQPFGNGAFFLQMQGGYSDTGSNPSSRGLVASPLNGQASRTTAGGQVSISDLLYTQHFGNKQAYISLGWTDPESFIDENRFAGNGRTQFVNTIFNNEPIFDSIDESLPIVAAGLQPVEPLRVTIFAQSTRRSALDRDQQKEAFEDMTDDPLIGGQVTYAPSFGALQGNYRFFFWTNTYEQPRLDNSEGAENWGLGFNMDQDITKEFGIFARLGRGNGAVNSVTWTWSAGTHWQGPLPGRSEDVWGVAAGGLQGNRHTSDNDMEFHYESYYEIKLADNFSIIPDITYVTNSNCNSENDDIVFGMLKFFFTFSTP